MDKVTRQCPQTTTCLKRKENRSGFEPRFFRLPAERLTARPSRLTNVWRLKRSLFYKYKESVSTKAPPPPQQLFSKPATRRRGVCNGAKIDSITLLGCMQSPKVPRHPHLPPPPNVTPFPQLSSTSPPPHPLTSTQTSLNPHLRVFLSRSLST